MTDNRKDTRERILDAAEHSFAARGFDGTSIRSIVEAARVNLAAVHYHFQSKEALLEAVLARRISVVSETRLKRLEPAEAAASPKSPSVEQILRAFIVPTVEFAHKDKAGATFVQLMSRMFTEPRFSLTDFLGRKFGDMIGRFTNALVRALPELPRELVLWRAFFTIGAMHQLLCSPSKVDLMGKGLRAGASDADMTEYLLEYSVAGMCTPTSSHVTKRNMRKTASSRKTK